ncbi:MAG TPA: hypothetical protein VFF20_10975 [Pseudogracilibacillus sp.]|nr:hypothetical protein [Pseudogracilibacillus sp.]
MVSSDRGKNEKIEANHPNKQAKLERDAMQADAVVEQSEQSLKREADRKHKDSKQATIGGF